MTEQLPPSTTLADVTAMHGVAGCLTPPLLGLHRPAAVVGGRAVTVSLEAGGEPPGLAPLYELLGEPQRGAVLVIGGAAEVDGAVFGQILARAAIGAGMVAAVVDGPVRDVADLAAEGLPVYARREHTAGAVGLARVVASHRPVCIGDVRIADGDLIVVDAGGAVCCPAASADRLLDDALRLHHGEQRVLDDLSTGVPLPEAYRHKREQVEMIRNGRTPVLAASDVPPTEGDT